MGWVDRVGMSDIDSDSTSDVDKVYYLCRMSVLVAWVDISQTWHK